MIMAKICKGNIMIKELSGEVSWETEKKHSNI